MRGIRKIFKFNSFVGAQQIAFPYKLDYEISIQREVQTMFGQKKNLAALN